MKLFALLTLAIFMSLPITFASADKTIVVDEKNPPKVRKKNPHNTKVINIKGSSSEKEESGSNGDICANLKGYYCKSVGRTAVLRLDQSDVLQNGLVLTVSGVTLGKISGVAWRSKGQPIGQYLGRLQKDMTLEEALETNRLSPSDSFYFIISIEGIDEPVLVEPHRIDTGVN